MGNKSREAIYGASIRAAAEQAAEARKVADRLAWNKRMRGFQGPAQPSPALGDALNAGYMYLEVKCLGCNTHQTVALNVVRRPKATPSPRTGTLRAVQGLLTASGAAVQAQPPCRAATDEGFGERSAINVVAGRAVSGGVFREKLRMSRQWGGVLRGDDYDLQDWRETLKSPFDPWVEIHGPDHVLRSASLDGLTSASEVRDRFVAHIERLNGMMFVMRQCHPLQFAGVAEFAADGKVHRTVFAALVVSERSDFFRASGVVVEADGNPKPEPPPKPSEAQNWAAIADKEDWLEDALIYFGRASAPDQAHHPPTFWFDIYKALECLISRFGGDKKSEETFFALDWVPAEVENLKRTANWARHARRKYQEPSRATTEQKAKELMSQLLRKAFEIAGVP